MTFSQENLLEVLGDFQISGDVQSIELFGNGHIHDTFRIVNVDQSQPDYLLQRINHEVFTNITGMMSNIEAVTSHLKNQNQPTLEVIKTREGDLYSADGNYWRVFEFIKVTKSFDIIETTEQAFNGGRAFGKFLNDMADFNAGMLIDTIPNFHNLYSRLAMLEVAMQTGIPDRLQRSNALISFVRTHSNWMCSIEELRKANKLPIRVTHNDTKFNNVLFDASDQVVCVIDLDTVMPGLMNYDFGDGVRTSTNLAAEDERDIKVVHFDIEKFKAFATGYIEGTQGVLTNQEILNLSKSGAVISFTMGVRFLTDYLIGDKYYKVIDEDQNFHRATCQLELAKQMMIRDRDLDQVIKTFHTSN